jgi:pyruvate kinase
VPIITRVDLLRHRRTKIIATIGPASQEPEVLQKLVEMGVDVFRLNMSHGDHDSHRKAYAAVRSAAARQSRHVAILADLCGPKIRVGTFKNGAMVLAPGQSVLVTTRYVQGGDGVIPSQYRALARDARPGGRLLLSDGELELIVDDIAGDDLHCTVIHGGIITDRKGINLPDTTVSAPSLTDKDRIDAKLMLDLGADFLALSFVRSADDVCSLREYCRELGGTPAIIAKIEKPEALENSDAILEAADGIMIARGDLGVELPAEQVPLAQSQLILKARTHNVPVIVATQMLESMLSSARPTRAEVTDVAYAVSSGTDAVMLSGETAAGKHPLQAVEMMSRIIRQTESYLWRQRSVHPPAHAADRPRPIPFGDAIADATALMAHDLEARAVTVISPSGMSAMTVSAARPAAPVIAISNRVTTCRRMSLLWGAIPIHADDVGSTNPNQVARRIAHELGIASTGQHILLVRGFHSDPELNTPSVTLLAV